MDTFLLMNIEKNVFSKIKNENVIQLLAKKQFIIKFILLKMMYSIIFIVIYLYHTFVKLIIIIIIYKNCIRYICYNLLWYLIIIVKVI